VSDWIFFGSSPLSSVGVSGMVVVGVGVEGEDGVGVEGIDVSGGSELFTGSICVPTSGIISFGCLD